MTTLSSCKTIPERAECSTLLHTDPCARPVPSFLSPLMSFSSFLSPLCPLLSFLALSVPRRFTRRDTTYTLSRRARVRHTRKVGGHVVSFSTPNKNECCLIDVCIESGSPPLSCCGPKWFLLSCSVVACRSSVKECQWRVLCVQAPHRAVQ